MALPFIILFVEPKEVSRPDERRLGAGALDVGRGKNQVPIRLQQLEDFAREVARDHEFGGVALRQGERALMLYACANRDPAGICKCLRELHTFGFGDR